MSDERRFDERDERNRRYEVREDARDDRARQHQTVRDEDLSRWQGGIDSTMTSLAVQVTAVATANQVQGERITALQIQVATLKTQIGVWSAVGGLIGAGIITLVVNLVVGK